MIGIYTSCNKENLPNGGEPRIKYVRITNPDSSDSLLVGAGQGNLIAIIGENLGGTVEMWFNDQQRYFKPNLYYRQIHIGKCSYTNSNDINNKFENVFCKWQIAAVQFRGSNQ